MRLNLPVSQRAYPLPEHATLLSTTDLDSRITYANEAFVQASGFERHELLGQTHNIVRHPDMPSEAFADMWATLKCGRSWTALVKNRRKDGDHYWVRANATPVLRGGSMVGYMSVRTAPAASEIEEAEALYGALRESRLRSREFRRGVLVHAGWLRWRSMLRLMPLSWRLRLGTVVAAALPIGAMLAAGGVGAPMAGAVAAILVAGWWLDAQVAAPLRAILQQASRVAAGTTAQGRTLDRTDEIGQLQRSIDQAGLNMRSLMDDVGEQAAGIAHATAGVAQGSSELGARTEQAAASLEQSAASLEQISTTLRANAENAARATHAARAASDAAANGGRTMGEVIQTMEHITAVSHRIADMTGLIGGIAFQTNMLALNASVESARAGEHGRGFAVVAGEVRMLAQRTAEAAREIKSLIGESSACIEAGNALAAKAGRAMDDIVAQSWHVSGLIGEIDRATHEQSEAIAQIHAAVSQLDETTQQNSAAVVASGQAVDELRLRTERLVQAVSVFGAAAETA